MKKNTQCWNQPESKMGSYKYGCYWNPSRGNVRIGKKEIKWYNLLIKNNKYGY